MRISEIFKSIQGEGIHAGIPMTFIRFQGCPWDCWWCDSRYTWDKAGGYVISPKEAAARAAFPLEESWVVLTGGEPLAQPEAFSELVELLDIQGNQIEVFTSGLNPAPPTIIFDKVDSWIVDIKCPSAKLTYGRHLFDLSLLRSQDSAKFVVMDERDLEFVVSSVEGLSTYLDNSPNILISPWMEFKANYEHNYIDSEVRMSTQIVKVESTPLEWRRQMLLREHLRGSSSEWCQRVAEFCLEHGFRLSLQQHKFVWGDVRGK